MPARIIVAEQQSIIRMDLAEILNARGHQVIAETGNFAETVTLALFLQPDLLILDRGLIPTVGDDPIDRIQRTQFPLAVLETYCVTPGIAGDRQSENRVYLSKPFAEDDLDRAVQQALAPAPPARDSAATRSAPPGDSTSRRPSAEAPRTRRHSAAGQHAARSEMHGRISPGPQRNGAGDDAQADYAAV